MHLDTDMDNYIDIDIDSSMHLDTDMDSSHAPI